jgi:hypothetical protein
MDLAGRRRLWTRPLRSASGHSITLIQLPMNHAYSILTSDRGTALARAQNEPMSAVVPGPHGLTVVNGG